MVKKCCSIVNGDHRRRCRNICKSAKRVDLLRQLHGSTVCMQINSSLSRFSLIHLHKWNRNTCVFIGGLPEFTQKNNLWHAEHRSPKPPAKSVKQCHSGGNNGWRKMKKNKQQREGLSKVHIFQGTAKRWHSDIIIDGDQAEGSKQALFLQQTKQCSQWVEAMEEGQETACWGQQDDT